MFDQRTMACLPLMFNVSTENREWVNRRCVPQALATFEMPVILSGKIENVKRRALYSGRRLGPEFAHDVRVMLEYDGSVLHKGNSCVRRDVFFQQLRTT